jgi:hypothetical protein
VTIDFRFNVGRKDRNLTRHVDRLRERLNIDEFGCHRFKGSSFEFQV